MLCLPHQSPPNATANPQNPHLMAPGSTDSVDSPHAAASNSSRLASSLLDRQQAQFTDSKNETTATARSKGGHTLSVSFWLSNPPDVSFFSVHCLKPPNHRTADFTVLPHVVGAEGRFVLIRANFYCHYGKDEYFMYKAGDGESPSLEWVPVPADENYGSLGKVKELGIVPRDHRDHYLLVALCDAHHGSSDYLLQIYSSETKAWSTRTLLNPCLGIQKIVPEKVIMLGEGLLGWVDLSRGLVACDLRQDPPGVRFIPLPEPLPENRDKLKGSVPGVAARSFRDVACSNGVLKFIEMEHHVTEKPGDPSDKDFHYDSDLIMSLKRKEGDESPKPSDGWRAVTWTRMFPSNGWTKGCTVDVADISVDESTNVSSSSLPVLNFPHPEHGRRETVEKLTFRDLYSAFPTLSMDGDDMLYLKSVATLNDRNGWVVVVDLRNKTGKALGVYSFEGHDPTKQAFCHCTLSRHLNMTPGTEIFACCKITQAGSSADDPNNTSIHVGRPIPRFKLTSKLRRPLAKETDHGQLEAQSIVQNDDISLLVPFPSNHVEARKKIQRVIMAEKIKRARNEAQSIVRNDSISQPHASPVQNNLTVQQCFNKPDGH